MHARKELERFLKDYEKQTNTHDFKKVQPLIATNAIYWFSDGTYKGMPAIRRAFIRTFNTIKDETYSLKNVRWLVIARDMGVCTYDFYWSGKVGGKRKSGKGRGTNVMVKNKGRWQMLHEHLSTLR
jgi:ketosteroid isomerase-like protein